MSCSRACSPTCVSAPVFGLKSATSAEAPGRVLALGRNGRKSRRDCVRRCAPRARIRTFRHRAPCLTAEITRSAARRLADETASGLRGALEGDDRHAGRSNCNDDDALPRGMPRCGRVGACFGDMIAARPVTASLAGAGRNDRIRAAVPVVEARMRGLRKPGRTTASDCRPGPARSRVAESQRGVRTCRQATPERLR